MSRFTGNLLQWPIRRTARTFNVRVIEPRNYEPDSHSDLFNAVLTHLISPQPEKIDSFTPEAGQPGPEPFDLVTFPEAFVAADSFAATLNSINKVTSLGCIHTGLRPSGDTSSRHLFKVSELRDLLSQLKTISNIVDSDLERFEVWLSEQRETHLFNVGCLFTVDANDRLRICLHPKIVRSKFEKSPISDKHMHEANLLTLITLLPVNKQLFSVTIQPLICSDALNLPTDEPDGPPMPAVNKFPECFEICGPVPDHVDIVSVATCTPQSKASAPDGSIHYMWHPEFQSSFLDAAKSGDMPRHHFSAIVLSNFQTMPSPSAQGVTNAIAGLSGIFLPVPPNYRQFHPDVDLSCWGHPEGDDYNRWSRPGTDSISNWRSRGFTASLRPLQEADSSMVRIFAFTIQRLPRDNSLWSTPESLTLCDVIAGSVEEDGAIKFLRVGP